MTNYRKTNKGIGSRIHSIGSSDHPYHHLYVYHIKGRLAPGTTRFPDSFIGNWQEDKFSFLFFSRPSRKNVKHLLSAQSHLRLLDSYTMAYDDWQAGKCASIRSGRLLIAPPWAKIWYNTKTDHNMLPIILDPGVVFGNGTHATTIGCLGALEMLFGRDMPQSALDLGTGTGLLALAATRLGCRYTVAVDNNLLAAKTAYRNVRLNHLADRVAVVQGNAEDMIALQADLIIANIHYAVMQRLISADDFFSKKWFVLSGLMREQARDVVAELAQRSATILKKWTHDDFWHTICGRTC